MIRSFKNSIGILVFALDNNFGTDRKQHFIRFEDLCPDTCPATNLEEDNPVLRCHAFLQGLQ